jgi:hypothetical protein
MVDHVHPSIEGHQRMADALAEKLVELGRVAPASDWQEKKRIAYQRHLAGLDDLYYIRGERKLKNLLLWTQGRARAVRPPGSTSNSTP